MIDLNNTPCSLINVIGLASCSCLQSPPLHLDITPARQLREHKFVVHSFITLLFHFEPLGWGSCFGGEGHQMATPLQRSGGEQLSHPLRQTGSSPAEGLCASMSPYGLPGAGARLWVGTPWVAWAALTHPEALPTGMRLVMEKMGRWRCGLDNTG